VIVNDTNSFQRLLAMQNMFAMAISSYSSYSSDPQTVSRH